MTMSDFQRAQLVAFAAREAGPSGSLEQMKGICYCIRNRVRAGWEDGSWLNVIENAHLHAAHAEDKVMNLNPESRELQRLLREIDDIYFGSSFASSIEEGMSLEGSLCEEDHEKKFWCFLNRPTRPWFQEHVLNDKQNHRSRTQMGILMFIE